MKYLLYPSERRYDFRNADGHTIRLLTFDDDEIILSPHRQGIAPDIETIVAAEHLTPADD